MTAIPINQPIPIPTNNSYSPTGAIVYISGAGLVMLGGAASLLAYAGQSPAWAATCGLGAVAAGIAGIVTLARTQVARSGHLGVRPGTPHELAKILEEIFIQVETVGKHGDNKMFVTLVKRQLEQVLNVVAHINNGILAFKGPRAVSYLQDTLAKSDKPVFLSLTPSVSRAIDPTLGTWIRSIKQSGKLPSITKVHRLEGVGQSEPSLEASALADVQAGIDVRYVSDLESGFVDQPEGTVANFLLAEGPEIGRVFIELGDGGASAMAITMHFDDKKQWEAYTLSRLSLERNMRVWGGTPDQNTGVGAPATSPT